MGEEGGEREREREERERERERERRERIYNSLIRIKVYGVGLFKVTRAHSHTTVTYTYTHYTHTHVPKYTINPHKSLKHSLLTTLHSPYVGQNAGGEIRSHEETSGLLPRHQSISVLVNPFEILVILNLHLRTHHPLL